MQQPPFCKQWSLTPFSHLHHTQVTKNLVLAGVNVTIQDTAKVSADDLSSQFFLDAASIGRNVRLITPSGAGKVVSPILTCLLHHPASRGVTCTSEGTEPACKRGMRNDVP